MAGLEPSALDMVLVRNITLFVVDVSLSCYRLVVFILYIESVV